MLRVKSGRLLVAFVCLLLFAVGLDCPCLALEAAAPPPAFESFLFLTGLVGEVEGQAGWPGPW